MKSTQPLASPEPLAAKRNRRAPQLAWLLLTALVLVPQTRGTVITIKLLGTWTRS